jgi:2-polyprenyl-6-methoxyphenol hydroxylase-like FAD-dependent oxidoreductase
MESCDARAVADERLRKGWSVVDADVIIVGAGPTGLMLAGELCLADARVLVLERLPHPSETQKAGGLAGQILELLHYRGELELSEAASTAPRPAPRFPWGGMHVDFTGLADPPMQALPLPQPLLERVLEEHATKLGAEIRRGREVVALTQNGATVTAEARGPDGPSRVTARYLVGCDGAHSRVRDMAGIPFPGTTYPDVHRLGQVTMPESVSVLENGDLDVAGVGRIAFGFTRTESGEFAQGSTDPALLGLFTSEEESADYDDDEPMTVTELRDSIRRVLGVDLPLGEPTRLTRFTFHARQVERYRDGRILLAGDAAHLFPAPGVALNAGLLDSVNLGWKLAATIHGWAPAGLLDTYHEERHLAGERTLLHTRAQVALRRGHDQAAEALRELFHELLVDEQALHRIGALMAGTDIRYPPPSPEHHALTGTFAPDLTLRTDQGTTSVAKLMRAARPIFLDLADRQDLRETAQDWQHRIDAHTAEADHRPADALLIRPDAHIAWAATIDEPSDTAATALRNALFSWFGAPHKSTVLSGA